MSYFCTKLTSDRGWWGYSVGRENDQGGDAGRRPGRNTTFEAQAYQDDGLPPIEPQDLIDPEMTGHAQVEEGIDGYHQPTAMFDKGEFLGELAELVDGAPETRAKVEAEEAPPKGCRLIIVAGPDLGMEWAFKTPEVVMGRDEECDLMMSDIAVSRRHAKISLEGDHFFLSDLGSGNGTYLNGARVEREELSPGDEITVGERTLRFVELNEAPPTAAAHPVAEGLPAEPVVGDPSYDDDGFEPLGGGASQVDADVASQVGPSVGTSAKASSPPPAAVPKPGAALKKAVTIGGAIAAVVIIAVGGLFGYDRYKSGQDEAMAMERASRELLQGIALASAKRCGDANVLFARVLEVRPEYEVALRYQKHCKAELALWTELETARLLATEGKYDEALEVLDKIPAQSTYGPDASAKRIRWQKILAERTVMRGVKALENGDFDTAEAIADGILEQYPGLSSALRLKQAVADARAGAKPKPVVRTKPKIPPILMRAIALYKNAQIGAAIDAAEAAGGERADPYVKKMKKMKKMLADAREAHRRKAAAEMLRIAPAALSIDKQIAHGEGKVRKRLESYYADGLYLKGIEAFQSGNDVKAFKYLSRALETKPGHRLAQTRLSELDGKARQIYWDGYVLKDSDPSKTRKIFKRLISMTGAKNEWHRRAKQWLKANPG